MDKKVRNSLVSGGLDVPTAIGGAYALSGLVGSWPVSALDSMGITLYFPVGKKNAEQASLLKEALPTGAKLNWRAVLTVRLKRKAFLADPLGQIRSVTAALDRCRIVPDDECPICHRPYCDCAAPISGNGHSYSLVHTLCLKDRIAAAEEKAADNAQRGSYLLGILGALLGMIAGCLPSVLTILFTQTVYALLVALIPIGSYYGYKLLGGRMNKTPLILSILSSVLGVFVLNVLVVAGTLVKEIGFSLVEAFPVSLSLMTDPEFRSLLVSDSLTYLLFAALGLLWSWRFISRTAESNVTDAVKLLELAKPLHPAAFAEETEEAFL
ncbi:MAG: hypothetical protein KBS46_07560 [Clostridiales bacterium]|nr:hypothetical protein [Candidatus Apopatocola equi]